MANKIKGVKEINCNWIANDLSLGDTQGSWKGTIVVFDDNFCIGYAEEEGAEIPETLLAGIFVDGQGMSICKLDTTKLDDDPLFFNSYTNQKCDKDTFYGFFSAKDLFDFVEKGMNMMTVKSKQAKEQEVGEIQEYYELLKDYINADNAGHALALSFVENSDYDEMSKKIKLITDSIKHDDLPSEFQKFSASQLGQ